MKTIHFFVYISLRNKIFRSKEFNLFSKISLLKNLTNLDEKIYFIIDFKSSRRIHVCLPFF